MTALRLRLVTLPEEATRELWVDGEGRLSYEPAADRHDPATVTGFALPGLVDAHCHVGLDAHGAVDEAEQQRQILTDRDSGALLLRDAGSPADTRWIDDRPDLPRLLRAGRHIARTKRYIRHYGEEIEPDQLVAEVERQAGRGDGWVKLVGDWIDRQVGDLSPCWPADVAAAAIARAHELGARVTAHCFGEQSVAELVAAGIDGIEHGTGISDDVAAAMAERRVALVPTRVQIDNFPSYAAQAEEKFPVYAAHMRDLHARADRTLRAAHDAGVPIFAGTDAGGVLPHGLIAREVRALHEQVGLPTDEALAAASWGAREWLGRPRSGVPDGIADGSPDAGPDAGPDGVDLVVYDTDPRTDLGVLARPRLVVLRGRVVAGRAGT